MRVERSRFFHRAMASLLCGSLLWAGPALAATAGDAVVALIAAAAGAKTQAEAQAILSGVVSPTLAAASPANGEQGVSLTRETILVFSAPVADGALPGAISAEAGNASLFFTQRVSTDRTRITLFFQNRLPAGARVRVTVRGNELHDDQGVPFDANGAAEGSTAVVSFDTIPLATVAGTAVCGRIFASEVGSAPGGATVDAPLEGVTVTVDGTENDFMPLQAVTDAMGDFCLDPAPAGTFFVHFDGRTVTNIPAGAPAVCQADPSPCYYPFVGKALSSVPGVTTSTMMGMPIQIYLPLVLPDVLQPVSATPGVDTTIGFPASVLEAAPPELQDIFAKVSITVPGGSLYDDDGSPGAMVGIAPVPSDRMPGPMPNGVEQPLVITVQTDGASNFDIPVSACFPNVGPKDPDTGAFTPGLHPGAKSALWSFDHDKGTFEVIGGMTVSEDGDLVCTDPGVGIPAPGWHFPGNGSGGDGDGGDDPCQDPPEGECPADCGPPVDDAAVGTKKIGCYTVTKADCDKACGFVNEHKIARQKAWDDFVDKCFTFKPNKLECPVAAIALMGENYKLSAALDRKEFFCSRVGKANEKAGPAQDALDAFDDAFLAYLESSGANQLAHDIAIAGDVTEEQQALAGEIAEGLDALPGAGGDFLAAGDALLAAAATELGPLTPTRTQGLGRELPYALTPVRGRTIRGLTRFDGGFAVNLPAADGASLAVFDAPSWRAGVSIVGDVPSGGGAVRFPNYLLRDVTDAPDGDADGLPDVAEHVLGTNALEPDTDGDGTLDGAEVRAGEDPLGAISVVQGFIAAADTPGRATGVCAYGDYVAVADTGGLGAKGVTIFNVFTGLAPAAVARVVTPGTSQAVACGEGAAAVADGDQGLAILDLSDPGAASVARRFVPEPAGVVRAVAVSGRRAYAGLADGRVYEVGLDSGFLRASANLGEPVQDLAVAGGVLYALTHADDFFAEGGTLHAIPLGGGALTVSGTAAAPGMQGVGGLRLRLFAGGGLAYATHVQGYDAFDLSDPESPVFLGQRTDALQAGWRRIVLSGADLAVGIDGANSTDSRPHFVTVYSVDPAAPEDDAQGFRIETPGSVETSTGPNDLALCNGLAYVADGNAGLGVLNYASFSPAGADPTVALSTGLPGGLVTEGAELLLAAEATGAPQVRRVEFLVDGVRVASDADFPWERPLRAPALADGADSFRVQARVTDGRGKTALSEELTIALAADVAGPQVLAFTPETAGSVLVGKSPPAFLALLDEPIDPATLAEGLVIVGAGPDGDFDTGDDAAAPGASVAYLDDLRAVRLAPGALPQGLWRVTVTTALADRFGNALAAPLSRAFGVFEPGDDSDGDCLSAALEIALGLDPTTADSTDLDADGLSNCDERDVHGTRVDRADSDGDALGDAFEVAEGLNPLNRDTDGDGVNDAAEIEGGCDPKVFESTTVSGRTINSDEPPEAVPGARVSVRGVTGASGGDGAFALANVPLCSLQASTLTALGVDGGRRVRGEKSLGGFPDEGGVTEVGDVTLLPNTGPHYSGAKTNVSPGPSAILAGDWDANGKPDLLALSNRVEGFNNVARATLLLGLGDGGFFEIERPAIGSQYVGLGADAGDANGDGLPDLVVTGTGVRFAPALGGVLGAAEALPHPEGGALSGPGALIADADGDGAADVLVGFAEGQERRLLLFPGDGDGAFGEPEVYDLARISPQAIRAADLNGDGLPDVVAAGTVGAGGNVVVLLGEPGGSLGAPQPIAVNGGGTIADIRLARLDEDETPDLAVAQAGFGVTVLLGAGDGTFAPQPPVAGSEARGQLAVGDFDGDDVPDIVATSTGFDGFSVLLGVGDGTFAVGGPIPAGFGPSSGNRWDLTAADFDLDGALDIATFHGQGTAGEGFSDVAVYFGAGDGTFAPRREAIAPPPTGATLAYAPELSGDALSDLLAFRLSGGGTTAAVRLGVGGGALGPVSEYVAATFAGTLASAAIADFDGANGTDFATVSRLEDFSGEVTTLFNAGDGTFPTFGLTALGDFRPAWIGAFDADGDGDADIAAAGVSAAAQGMGDSRRRIAVLANDGAGAFAPGAPFLPEANAQSLLFADLDGDPRPDLVAVCGPAPGACANAVSVSLRNPDLSFAPATAYGVGTGPLAAAAADVDGDGDVDVVVANADSRDVSLLLGVGDGTLEPAMRLSGCVNASSVGYCQAQGVAIVDATGDGELDIVVTGRDEFAVLAGDGAGGFANAARFSAAQSGSGGFRPAAFGDFSGRGLPDFVFPDGRGVILSPHR